MRIIQRSPYIMIGSWLRNAAAPAAVGFLVLANLGPTCFATVPVIDSNTEQEKALRTRVEEFYVLLQQGMWTRAEAYVTEDSLEEYRSQSKNRLLGCQIESTKVDPDGQSATAVVRVKFVAGLPPVPMEIPRTTRWRLVGDRWYLVTPRRDLNALQSLFASRSTKTPGKEIAREELKFKGHRYNFATIQPGQIKVARFPFTNVTDHVVTLAQVLTGCKCLQVKTEKKLYKPGESGEVVIEFDPTGYERDYAQTIVVKTDPGGLSTHLNVTGFITPRPRQAPKGEGAQPAPSPHP
jgi:hypothetical protein